ncbi:MAG: helix-turn-helix transcriptional regulator [Puniceicoccales bacterium]|jgi:AraC-like DNA-binding protein|nr:helix-turn-helix transcriptional regulator [Puniceicoccales bacterium]
MEISPLSYSWYEPLQQLANYLDFSITHAIHIQYDNDYVFHNHLPQSRLIFVESVQGADGGCIEILSGSEGTKSLPIHPKTLFFFPPNLDLVFNYRAGLSCIGIHFNLSLVPGIDIFETQQIPYVIPFADAKTLKRLHTAIWNKNNLQDLLWAKSALLDISTRFIENNNVERHLSAMRFAQKYAAIIQHIDSNLRIDTDLEPIAKQSNLTYDSLQRNFRKDIGITLHAWLARRISREAARALAETDEPLKGIATRLGFSSAAYFHRFIKKHLQTSPSEYRSLHQQK